MLPVLRPPGPSVAPRISTAGNATSRYLSTAVSVLCLIMLPGIAAVAQTATPGPNPAQSAPLPDVSPQYVISYIEVRPDAAGYAAKLGRNYRDATRKESGVFQFEYFQRVGTPHHFAIVGQWKDTQSFVAHSQAAHTVTFRNALAGHLSAPYDERRHHSLNVGEASDAGGSLVAITHVDIIPTSREAGIESVKVLADQSRGTPGNLRFDALTQSNRTNHMTLVEVWRDTAAYHSHLVAPHLRSFRDALLPRSGSLFDERLYKAAD